MNEPQPASTTPMQSAPPPAPPAVKPQDSEEAAVPPGVRKWNWGGFFLTFIWGIGNKVWISFLVFIPLIGIIIPFYLGAKGNELAWRSKKWESVEQFHDMQKNWAIAGLIFFLLFVLTYLFVPEARVWLA